MPSPKEKVPGLSFNVQVSRFKSQGSSAEVVVTYFSPLFSLRFLLSASLNITFAAMKEKPSIPKGTRDFPPAMMVKRNFIFDTIRSVFKLYGFLPLETPAMENITTLTGKYGDEGDQLIFKILNSRLYESKEKEKLKSEFDRSLEHNINSAVLTERALRYDLTVPFARFVVMHQNEITFPFRRYQLQPVWRADKPQKGRYREFYQCDADIVGSNSLMNEVELVLLMDEVFSRLKMPVVIKINNRKILAGIADEIGEKDRLIDITVAIDKLDKIGLEKVLDELSGKGVSAEALEKLKPFFSITGSTKEKLSRLSELINSDNGKKGIAEAEEVFGLTENKLKWAKVELDITLARGLNYYTGAIFEVKADAGSLSSSITGGGRYDDLTGIFGLPGVSGVGISFGADRIYDVMEELNLFPQEASEEVKVLFVSFGKEEQLRCLELATELRSKEIACEVYPEAGAKMKKQMGYADARKIPFVAIIGGDELASGNVTLKNMKSGEQEKVPASQLIEKVKY